MNTIEPWEALQYEISQVLKTYAGQTAGHIYVYKLLKFSIDIIVEQTGTILHLKRTELTSNGCWSKIVITSNKRQNDLIVSADPDQGFVLASGQILSVNEFCEWLFDLALKLSDPALSP